MTSSEDFAAQFWCHGIYSLYSLVVTISSGWGFPTGHSSLISSSMKPCQSSLSCVYGYRTDTYLANNSPWVREKLAYMGSLACTSRVMDPDGGVDTGCPASMSLTTKRRNATQPEPVAPIELPLRTRPGPLNRQETIST
ncbi:hypothetical protein CGRA01v4_11919 [Colletotrichum graminicola]|nr:hypothetical protein CGRA01v4_11919 [Colletotrichum graminicola]